MNTMEVSEPPLGAETVSPTRSQGEDVFHFNPQLPEGPIFKPPNSSPDFICNYSAIRGWKHTAGPGARTQWLKKTNTPNADLSKLAEVFIAQDL